MTEPFRECGELTPLFSSVDQYIVCKKTETAKGIEDIAKFLWRDIDDFTRPRVASKTTKHAHYNACSVESRYDVFVGYLQYLGVALACSLIPSLVTLLQC